MIGFRRGVERMSSCPGMRGFTFWVCESERWSVGGSMYHPKTSSLLSALLCSAIVVHEVMKNEED